MAEPDFAIRSLGACRVDSTLEAVDKSPGESPRFVADSQRIALDDSVPEGADAPAAGPALELAGPRRRIFFEPAQTGIGIVSCGGLCPGVNDVIRGLVMHAWYRYGVRRIHGFRYGFAGLVPEHGHDVMELTPAAVNNIHELGGSVLGSSRGPQDIGRMLDRLAELSIDILFVIGGDGTLRGALALAAEIERRSRRIAVVGLPKTIDNDIRYIDRSFGYETAYGIAVEAIRSAHAEAIGTLNGIGLVKVMGRHSGALACAAALATGHVNFILIPELPTGPGAEAALLEALIERLEARQHAVILVAEGFGQDLAGADPAAIDKSGNVKLVDIGPWLARRLTAGLRNAGIEHSLKYIDPSYMVRSVPASPSDSVYCWQLARNAVHAAMCGKTAMMVGLWHGRIVHVPIEAAVSGRKQVDVTGDLWLSVLESMGQAPVLGRETPERPDAVAPKAQAT